MRYTDIDWHPLAIAIGTALLVVLAVRILVWLGPRNAIARTVGDAGRDHAAIRMPNQDHVAQILEF